jgi:2-iminoacetate synthase
MSFYRYLQSYRSFDIEAHEKSATPDSIETPQDFLLLLSDAALLHLESMARKAHTVTKGYFGNVIFIFTPLYISNYCDNGCRYCSFASHQAIARKQLSLDEIDLEAKKIHESGIRHILVLTGESRKRATMDYLRKCMGILKKYFSSIAIEIYPLHEAEYRTLIEAGVDGLTIYQETYNEDIYTKLHKGGPKENYRYRVEAAERALKQKMRTVTIGPLLGLYDPVAEAFYTALHLKYLQDRFPEAEISVSLPRIRPLVSDFTPSHPVEEKQFVQLLLAFRLFGKNIGITISTREGRDFRKSILPLGVTKMSAGVSTAVGGHLSAKATGQFEIADTRQVFEIREELLGLGYQPVMHDWNFNLTL